MTHHTTGMTSAEVGRRAQALGVGVLEYMAMTPAQAKGAASGAGAALSLGGRPPEPGAGGSQGGGGEGAGGFSFEGVSEAANLLGVDDQTMLGILLALGEEDAGGDGDGYGWPSVDAEIQAAIDTAAAEHEYFLELLGLSQEFESEEEEADVRRAGKHGLELIGVDAAFMEEQGGLDRKLEAKLQDMSLDELEEKVKRDREATGQAAQISMLGKSAADQVLFGLETGGGYGAVPDAGGGELPAIGGE